MATVDTIGPTLLTLELERRALPWRTHAWVMALLTATYVAFALVTWPSGDSVSASLGQVVVILYGIGLVTFALLTTILLGMFRVTDSPLAFSYVTAGALVGLLGIALLGTP
jgi:hypothetical protein